MNKIIYRELLKDDYDKIKELINEAFGFGKIVKDKKFLDKVLTIYLEDCIVASSFSKVAVKNDEVIGIILGDCKNDNNKLKKFHNILSLALNTIKLSFSSKENKLYLKEFSKITQTYKELISGKESNFQGCIQLFIVTEKCRGLGIGKALIKYTCDYMKTMNVKSIYLYTDTICNYGFYDSQNFKRLAEKEIYFNSLNSTLNVFLYGYTF
ncbi:GNAT family N-acetyltransferase [Clostridium ihumii]|uniref:GNAT family N-acetyltransferase n=1 Tax=Clostridium ihumii TaxID=1470356 RepID=UPI003D3455CD